jgi:hypothetical protein
VYVQVIQISNGVTAFRAEAREINADWQEKRPPSPFGLRRGSLARCASEGWWALVDDLRTPPLSQIGGRIPA